VHRRGPSGLAVVSGAGDGRREASPVRVLVTGARGMLGAAVARALAARGDTVTVLQRGSSRLPFPEVRADLGDPADADALATAVDGCDAVLHLAAKVDVVGPWRDYARTNVEGTRALLDAAVRAGVGRFVHVSSPSVAHAGSALVGVGAGPADPARARGHYARSKALAELLVLAPPVSTDRPDMPASPHGSARPAVPERATRRAETHDSPYRNARLAVPERTTRRTDTHDSPAVVVVRPHLVWGPGDPQLVGRIVARAQAGRLVLVGTGAALVDTTYVDNAVDALLAALDRAPQHAGQVFVVSNGEPRPVAELVAAICCARGVGVPRVAVPAPVARAAGAAVEKLWPALHRHGDPPLTRFLAEQLSTAHWFDQRATREALGWVPRIGLDEGFARLRAG
jgi:2-alkyl-3-oxoalkanoate reductase